MVHKYPRQFYVKIVDFGLSQYLKAGKIYKFDIGVEDEYDLWQESKILVQTNIAYHYRPNKPDLKATDVYSFAIICYEVLTVPYNELCKYDCSRVIEGYMLTAVSTQKKLIHTKP